MSSKYLITDYGKPEYVVNILKSRTYGKDILKREYIEPRKELLPNKVLQDVVPTFVKTNGELNSFWRFIKVKFEKYDDITEFKHENRVLKEINFVLAHNIKENQIQ